MSLKHKVTINVTTPSGVSTPVLRSNRYMMRSKLLDFLFGEKVSILVVSPGDSVETVEIHELKEGGNKHGC